MTLQSMTGYAQITGAFEGASWQWDVRSVNGRGLDLRIRLPDGCESLEPAVRVEAAKWLRRGSVSLVLKLSLPVVSGAAQVNADVLSAAISAARQVEEAARTAGLAVTSASVDGLMSQRGVLDAPVAERSEEPGWLAALRGQLGEMFEALVAARNSEGLALAKVLGSQVSGLEKNVAQAQAASEARAARAGDLLRQRVAELLDATDVVDEARLAQELAILAVKSDITEEIDRLQTHVEAARSLLAEGGVVGRKFDFLIQEMNREANTICSKAGSGDLTAIGLDMKVLIDQMREQVQNLE